MTRLAGKAALVVGGGTLDDEFPGTGSAIAQLLARAGARVAVLGRTPERTQRTVDLIAAAGGEAVPVLGDATIEVDCERAVSETVEAFGRLDVLVNNLGAGVRGSVAQLTDEDWTRSIDINLRTVVVMTKHALPHLVAAGRSSVINISSIAGIRAFGAAAYAATKGGLIAMTQDMALAHGRDGVRVNVIVPGHLYTPIGTGFGDEKTRALKRDVNMLGVDGTGWDVGWTAVFLASDESRFITAAAIPVDGGVSVTGPLAAVGRMLGGAYG